MSPHLTLKSISLILKLLPILLFQNSFISGGLKSPDGGRNKFLDNAKAFLAIYERDEISLKRGTELKFSSDHFVEYDIGEFVAYLTLSAQDKGLGSCIIGWVNNDKINDAFNLKGRCNIVVALGYASYGNTCTKSRLGVKDIILN